VSVAVNGLLLLGLSISYSQPALFQSLKPQTLMSNISNITKKVGIAPDAETNPQQKSLSYEQWLDILRREAKAAAANQPERLTVLLGDSLSLWFPLDMLPEERAWLNQGISGETTAGLLKRLNLLDEVKPTTILVMIGINDLIQNTPPDQVLQNYRQILQTLHQAHPKAELVVQSILPHGGNRLTVDNRDEVTEVSNQQIHALNLKLQAMAQEVGVQFLNLHPLFLDKDGLLRAELSTDGLHLNQQGYLVWQSAFQVFDQLSLQQPNSETSQAIEKTPDHPAADGAVDRAADRAESTSDSVSE
jgi:lysophospholipase L1-like esterase